MLLFASTGCGASHTATYPQTWAMQPTPAATAQIESLGWDAASFWVLVASHAQSLCAECDVSFHLGRQGGVVRIDSSDPGNGTLGAAANGSGLATVHQSEVLRAILGPAPEYPALAYTTIDEAARLFAVIVAHEVGHALSLPHNRYSTVMHASPRLLTSVRHEFTPDEIDRMRSATGQRAVIRPGSEPGLCPCCIAPGVRIANCEE